MTLRNLEIFAAVCKHMNMSKAAENLMISQSSVSQAVSALEKEYNVVLFERLNHKLYLTQAGQELFFLSLQVLRSVDQLETQMHKGSRSKTIRLGACNTIGSCLIHPLISDFNTANDVTFDVEINNSSVLEDMLLEAKMDIAIIQVSKMSPSLVYIPLLKDSLTIICPSDHPLAGRKASLKQLQHENFVLRERGSGSEYLLEQAFSSQNLQLNRHWICNNPEAIKTAVINGQGIALMSRFLIEKELSQGLLSEIHVKEKLFFNREFALAYHKNKLQDGTFIKFVDYCKEHSHEGMELLISRSLRI